MESPAANTFSYWPELSLMFTSLEAVLLKIGKGIESWFGNTFLTVLNSFPLGFNSMVSIKF